MPSANKKFSNQHPNFLFIKRYPGIVKKINNRPTTVDETLQLLI
jgi:hypothetical protein